MAQRTTATKVRSILRVDEAVEVEEFIDMAVIVVDQLSSEDSDSVLSTACLMAIEQLLSCHFYAVVKQRQAAKRRGRTSATFQGRQDMFFAETDYGTRAMSLDFTGYLAKLNQQNKNGVQKVGFNWLGKPVSQQTDYEDRD